MMVLADCRVTQPPLSIAAGPIYAFSGGAIPSIQHGSIVDGGLDEIA